MNGPQRLLESDAGPLAEALRQARAQVPADVRLAQIAENLARQGMPVDPGAIPAAAKAAPAWSFGAKLATSLLGVLVVAALVVGLRAPAKDSAPAPKAFSSPSSAAAAASSITGNERAPSRSGLRSPASPSETSTEQQLAEQPTEALDTTPTAPREGELTPALDGSAAIAERAPSRLEPSSEHTGSGEAVAAANRSNGSAELAPSRTSATPRSGGTAEKEPEVAILAEARSALSGNPAAALALTERHRSLYPRGSFVQERELIAITALARLGQTAAAQDRAARFRASYPRSAYLKQIDRVVGAP